MTTPETDIKTAIQNWLDAVKTHVLDPEDAQNQRTTPYTVLKMDKGSKFLRILATHGSQDSAWAFVALGDGENKALGRYRKGDIFKSASSTTPAKTPRGNVYENLPTCNIKSWLGPDYLRK
jgi:hypothetical protein